jgi:hypothetical protein
MTHSENDALLLRAAIEFGSEYLYTIKNGGHGPTLVIHAENKTAASGIRRTASGTWEGLFVLVTYCTAPSEEDYLYDSALT